MPKKKKVMNCLRPAVFYPPRTATPHAHVVFHLPSCAGALSSRRPPPRAPPHPHAAPPSLPSGGGNGTVEVGRRLLLDLPLKVPMSSPSHLSKLFAALSGKGFRGGRPARRWRWPAGGLGALSAVGPGRGGGAPWPWQSSGERGEGDGGRGE